MVEFKWFGDVLCILGCQCKLRCSKYGLTWCQMNHVMPISSNIIQYHHFLSFCILFVGSFVNVKPLCNVCLWNVFVKYQTHDQLTTRRVSLLKFPLGNGHLPENCASLDKFPTQHTIFPYFSMEPGLLSSFTVVYNSASVSFSSFRDATMNRNIIHHH